MRTLTALVLTAVLSVGCSANLGKPLVTADTATVNALLDVKAAKDVRCDAGELPASTCKALAAAFVPVWDAYLAANALVTAEVPVEKLDEAITNFKTAATNFRDVVNTIQGNARQILLDLLAKALSRFDR